MPAYEIWDFLSTAPVAANYVSTDFSLASQTAIPEMGVKNQIVHLGDDGSEEVVSFNTTSVFHVTLQWDALNEADSGTIFNFYHSTGLGNGIARSFRWAHPTDGHKYTVKFRGPLTRNRYPGSIFSVGQIQLKIMGRAT